MIKTTSKTTEFDHFETLAQEWWNPDGKFKILHTLTPIRISYIKNKLFDKKYSKKSLSNFNILDLGCGGGLVCEPLARLGANITGIDFIKQNIIAAKNHAKKTNTNIEYLHQDINNLKLKKKYNAVLI
ncbi:MAG TPA: bifunctional 2-polyprenyl-6-hydroxyphenol methylase/3-demethylubiquinol 3-O-methyltransferase UbiG, partial [Alphaproteobacteria bacterium]|nr:bifunctional 2-polyprenyl-6-hydroxyphenol methylase/3-demethylubiquinol 3-O-methyltransferase UbiG [Alphaproteobacteria bacterium]